MQGNAVNVQDSYNYCRQWYKLWLLWKIRQINHYLSRRVHEERGNQLRDYGVLQSKIYAAKKCRIEYAKEASHPDTIKENDDWAYTTRVEG